MHRPFSMLEIDIYKIINQKKFEFLEYTYNLILNIGKKDVLIDHEIHQD